MGVDERVECIACRAKIYARLPLIALSSTSLVPISLGPQSNTLGIDGPTISDLREAESGQESHW